MIQFKDTYVGHFIEGPFQGIGVFFPLLFIEFNIYAFLYSLFIINIRGMLRHDNRFIWLIGNHHILHHKHPKYNFGEYWLDKLFQTNYPNINEYEFAVNPNINDVPAYESVQDNNISILQDLENRYSCLLNNS